MTERVTNSQTEGDLLGQVHEGMEVYDRDQKKVGKVDGLFMGARADGEGEGSEPARGPGPEAAGDGSIIADVARVFDDNMPEVLRSRLRHNGFIRVGGGILSGDRFALREHVASVAGDRVILNVRGEELIGA